jgi:hypothetical protein
MADFFWISDSQWARIEPHLPMDVRGKKRVDDRRVLSGIVHALKLRRALGGLRRCLWTEEDTLQSLCALVRRFRASGAGRRVYPSHRRRRGAWCCGRSLVRPIR